MFRTILLLAISGCLLVSCASLQVPLNPPSFPSAEFSTISQDEITIRVKPIVSEEDYLELFDENLPRNGVVALWVEMNNGKTTAIDFKKDGWLLLAGGRSFAPLPGAKMLERFYAANHTRMISENADAESRRRLERIELAAGPLRPGTKREGFLFFRIDPRLSSTWSRGGASLLVRDVRLDGRHKKTMEIVLPHANS